MSWLVLYPAPEATPGLASRDAVVGPTRPGLALSQSLSGWRWLLSPDGQAVARQGAADEAVLPTADRCVLVLPAGMVSWHAAALPKVAATRLPAALAGALEDQLLDEVGEVHFALQGGATNLGGPAGAGAPAARWVAAVHKPLLQRLLALWAERGCPVDAVVAPAEPLRGAPAAAPASGQPTAAAPSAGRGHGFVDAAGTTWVRWADAQGVVQAPLNLLRSRIPTEALLGADWSAEPAAIEALAQAFAAQHPSLQQPGAMRMLNRAEDALRAAREGANLLQFGLAPSRRGLRRLREALAIVRTPAWAGARRGAAALLALGLLGPSVLAAFTERDLQRREAQAEAILRQSFPEVRAVLDAPLQMERQVQAMRTGAGQPGPADLERLLGALAAAWPADQPPPASLSYDGNALLVAPPGGNAAALGRVSEALRAAGLSAAVRDGQLELRPAR